MNEMITINPSPALTFAKLKMNGDRILLNTGDLNKQNVIVTVSGRHSRGGTLYEEPIPAGTGGEDLDRLLSFDRRILTAEGDIHVNSVFIGPGSCGMIVRIARGTSARIVEITRGGGDYTAVRSALYLLEEGASLTLVQVQQLDKRTLYIDDLRARLAENAQLKVTRLDLGGAVSYQSSKVLLEGKNADYAAHGNFLLNGDQRLDINMIAEHIAPNTVSDMHSDGVLLDRASKIFRGSLDFKSGCKGSKGSENEDVMLLSDGADNQSMPIILCGEEDVEGNHGATVGRVSDDTLYYLASRGFDEEKAYKMIVRSRMNATIACIPDADLRDELEKTVDEVLA